MSNIGNRTTPVPITGNQLQDGLITSSKIASGDAAGIRDVLGLKSGALAEVGTGPNQVPTNADLPEASEEDIEETLDQAFIKWSKL